ncbi:MCE family protein [Rhodococcus sp. NPDC047139]|uniref:MCE family protein n=1 Tax=Rhodococcus sp. NPDC047139 TaxID=3155141 RepID=UPI0033C32C59
MTIKWVVRGIALLAIAGVTSFFVLDRVRTSEEAVTVTARFDNAAGLYEGNEVSVLGIPVGRVSAIAAHGTHVAVTMEIDAGIDIPADVQAVAVSTSVLTDRHVELTPVYRSGPTLEDGAVIGSDRTRTPIEFDRLLAMADTLALELEGDGAGNGPVARLLDVGEAMTAGNGVGIRAALGRLSDALRMSAEKGAITGNEITTIIDNLSVLTDIAAANDTEIREFGEATRRLGEVLADARIGEGDTGTKLNEILGQAEQLLESNRGAVQSTVTNAESVVRAIVDYRNEVAEFLDLSPLLLANAYNAIDQEHGAARVHAQLEKVFFDGHLVSQVCAALEMRDVGCTSGNLRDFGPGFGIASMLEGIAGLPR